MNELSVPTPAMCLVCRVALAPGEPCDFDPKHPTAPLTEGAGRERALAAVWGPPSARAQARRLTRAGASGGIAGGAAEVLGHGCGGCGELAGAGELGAVIGVILAIVAVALSAVIVVWLIGRAVTAWQRRKHRLLPMGAPRGLPMRGATWVEGVVEGRAPMPSWTGEEDCLAWGVEVLADAHRGGAVLLRDGRTTALTLRLDDGRVVRVPEGRARVWSAGELPEGARESVKGDALRGLLGGLAEGEDEYEVVIPAERAESVMIGPGDRVRLGGALVPAGAGDGGYREGAQELLATGVPRLVRVG